MFVFFDLTVIISVGFLAELQFTVFCLRCLSESASFMSHKQFVVYLKRCLFPPLVDGSALHKKAGETEVSPNNILFPELLDTSGRAFSTGRTSRRSIQREGPVDQPQKHARVPDPVKPCGRQRHGLIPGNLLTGLPRPAHCLMAKPLIGFKPD